MANKSTEKNIGGAVSAELADEFATFVKTKRFKQKKLFKSFALWFMSIDDDQQQVLYNFDIEKELSMSDFIKQDIITYLSSPEGQRVLIVAIGAVGKSRK